MPQWAKQVAWTAIMATPTALIFAFNGSLRIAFVAISALIWLSAVLYVLRGHYVVKNLWNERQNKKASVRRWLTGAQWRFDVGNGDLSPMDQFYMTLGIPYAAMPGGNVPHPRANELRATVSIREIDGEVVAEGNGSNVMGTMFAVYPHSFDGDDLAHLQPGIYEFMWTNTIRNEVIGGRTFEIGADGKVVVPRKISRRIKRRNRLDRLRTLRGLEL